LSSKTVTLSSASSSTHSVFATLVAACKYDIAKTLNNTHRPCEHFFCV
jgi:hypothetical protein